uniref:Uncharacterized protein n=1 Tax=viral metagenome TaxID=1070528 RepID=A0A6C0H5E1_9ZZZZ
MRKNIVIVYNYIFIFGWCNKYYLLFCCIKFS